METRRRADISPGNLLLYASGTRVVVHYVKSREPADPGVLKYMFKDSEVVCRYFCRDKSGLVCKITVAGVQ